MKHCLIRYFTILFFLAALSGNLFCQDKNEFSKIILSVKNTGAKSQLRTNGRLDNSLFSVSEDSSKKTDSQKSKTQYKVKPWRITLLGAAALGVFTAMHLYYKDTWWKDQRHFFKYAEDGYYARNIDKLSHIYTANVFTVSTAYAYEWTGISPSRSLLYGAITAMAYETYIEINDGFAPNWGFDWIDMASNLFGALYPFAQKEAPLLENFTFKWSFKPSWLKGKVQNTDDLLDDYTNMTFWIGVSPEGLLPKKIAKYYPGFLGFALGFSVKNASHVKGSTNAYREVYLSLDYDITKLPGDSDFLKKLKKILNFYHFPAPAVRISPSGIWYGLYF